MLAKLWRALFCKLGRCMRCKTAWDDHAVWGECVDCGARHGVTTRETLRRYIEAEERGKAML